jgi:hypothetical protein
MINHAPQGLANFSHLSPIYNLSPTYSSSYSYFSEDPSSFFWSRSDEAKKWGTRSGRSRRTRREETRILD